MPHILQTCCEKGFAGILIISELWTIVPIVQQQSVQKAEKEGRDRKELITSGFVNRSWFLAQNAKFIYRCQNWQEQVTKGVNFMWENTFFSVVFLIYQSRTQV